MPSSPTLPGPAKRKVRPISPPAAVVPAQDRPTRSQPAGEPGGSCYWVLGNEGRPEEEAFQRTRKSFEKAAGPRHQGPEGDPRPIKALDATCQRAPNRRESQGKLLGNEGRRGRRRRPSSGRGRAQRKLRAITASGSRRRSEADQGARRRHLPTAGRRRDRRGELRGGEAQRPTMPPRATRGEARRRPSSGRGRKSSDKAAGHHGIRVQKAIRSRSRRSTPPANCRSPRSPWPRPSPALPAARSAGRRSTGPAPRRSPT